MKVDTKTDDRASNNIKKDTDMEPPGDEEKVYKEETPKEEFQMKDRGWGWVVVASCMLINVINGGLERSKGIMYVIFSEKFNSSAAVTAYVFALVSTMRLCGGPVIGILLTRVSCRFIVICGAIASFVGSILSMFAHNIGYMFFSYGFIGGIGALFVYVPSVIILSYYFEKRLSLATGLSTSGVGLGSVIMPPLIDFLYEQYAFFGLFLVIGGVYLYVIPIAMLLRPTSVHTRILRNDRIRKERKSFIKRHYTETKVRECTIDTTTKIYYHENPQEDVGGYLLSYEDRRLSKKREQEYADSIATPVKMNADDDKASIKALGKHSSQINDKHSKVIDRSHSITHVYPPTTNPTTTNPLTTIPSATNPPTVKSVPSITVDESKDSLNHPPISCNGECNTDTKTNLVKSHHDDDRKRECKSHCSTRTATKCLGSTSMLNITNQSLRPTDIAADINLHKSLQNLVEIDDEKVLSDHEKAKKRMCHCYLLKKTVFCLFCVSLMFITMALHSVMTFLPPLITSCGISTFDAAILVGVMGAADCISRMSLFGYGFDLECIVPYRMWIYNLLLFLLSMCALLTPFVKTFAGFAVLSVAYGILTAGIISPKSVIIVDILSVEMLPFSFGILLLFQGVGSMTGSPLSGVLKDYSNSYDYSFYLSCAFAFIASVLFLIANIIFRKKKSQKNSTSTNSSRDPSEAAPLTSNDDKT